jgi:subtilase family serine protease
MRRSPSTLFSLSNSLTLILCILISSAVSFAAAPDRIASAVNSSQTVRLSAGLSSKAQPQFDRGPVDPSFKINYMTLLTVPSASQQKAITKLLAQQQDPRSPQYHKWLTSEQYADRFGLSQNDIRKITAWLQSQGFNVDEVARNRNWIVFSGTAAQVEIAFKTSLHNFDVNGEMHYANTTLPSIPAGLSGIVAGIRGLNNFRAQSHIQVRKPDYSFPVSGGFNLFLAPGDIETIYDLGPLYAAGIHGEGQKLAVMGRTDIYLADLADFRSGFGLPAISSSNCTLNSSGVITACNDPLFQYVLNGPDPGVNPFPQDDLPEADLDIEWSGAVAYNAQIIYVNSGGKAGDVFTSFYHTIDNDLAPVITMSYGLCELGEVENGSLAADEAELQLANMKGITFMTSSGDSGAAQCDPNISDPNGTLATGGLAVNYPASSPEITAVGGTMIPFSEYSNTYWNTSNGTNGGSVMCPNPTGPCIPEGAWNDAFEIGAYCSVHTCSGITNAETAQSALGIASTGGGASNCTTVNGSGDCTGGFAQPSWQTVTVSGQAAARFVPDVSLLASANLPGYIWCTQVFELGDSGTGSSCAPGGSAGISNALSLAPNQSVAGGTSVASPVFAGIVALLNQYLVKNNVQSAPGLGNINPNLYQIAIAHPAAFNPVTASDFVAAPGSNQVYCSPGSPGVPPTALQCPAAVPPATEGLFGFLSANADATTGYNLVTGLGSVDANVLATVWESSKTLPSVTVSAAPNAINYGASVLLTATVSTTANTGTATGTVTFLSNGTSIGSPVALDGTGKATLTTTTLPPGTDHITASYAGDLYNQPFISPTAATVTVTAATFTFTNTGSASHTVLAGQTTLAYTFLATPTSGSTFAGAVNLSCSFAPTDTTLTSCAFTPASIAGGGVNGATTVSMTIKTTGPNTTGNGTLRHRADNRSPWLPLTMPIAGLVVLGLMRGKVTRKVSKRSAITLFCFSLILVGFMLACGGGGGSTPPPPPVSVSVTPSATVQLYANEAGNSWPASATQQQFSATVNNSTNQSVTWAVAASADGTVSSSGLYTAPATVPSPATVSVTATAAADATKSGSGMVSILTPTAIGAFTVTVSATETGAAAPITRNVTLNVQ